MRPYHAVCEMQNIRGDGSAGSTDHLPLSKTTTAEKVFRWGYAKQPGSRGPNPSREPSKLRPVGGGDELRHPAMQSIVTFLAEDGEVLQEEGDRDQRRVSSRYDDMDCSSCMCLLLVRASCGCARSRCMRAAVHGTRDGRGERAPR